jgi:hypothetical protein
MSDGHYILPSELAAIAAVVFLPPLLLAFAAQTVIFVRCAAFSRGRRWRAALGYFATAVVSIVLGVVLFLSLPDSLGPLLGIHDIRVAGHFWPVMPLTFLAVAPSAAAIAFWVCRSAKRSA